MSACRAGSPKTMQKAPKRRQTVSKLTQPWHPHPEHLYKLGLGFRLPHRVRVRVRARLRVMVTVRVRVAFRVMDRVTDRVRVRVTKCFDNFDLGLGLGLELLSRRFLSNDPGIELVWTVV